MPKIRLVQCASATQEIVSATVIGNVVSVNTTGIFWDQRLSLQSSNERRQRLSAHGRFVFIPLPRMNRSVIVLSSLLLRLMYVLVENFLCSMNSHYRPRLIFVVRIFVNCKFVNCISCCGYLSSFVVIYLFASRKHRLWTPRAVVRPIEGPVSLLRRKPDHRNILLRYPAVD